MQSREPAREKQKLVLGTASKRMRSSRLRRTIQIFNNVRRFGVCYPVIAMHQRSWSQACGIDAGSHDVEYSFFACKEIIRDQAAMAAPPHRLGAHNSAYPAFPFLDELIQSFVKCVGERIVSIVVKASVLPEAFNSKGIVCAFDRRPPSASNRRYAIWRCSSASDRISELN
jgi:hypothetical protein